ncbi:MAG: alkaline phosphatase D family protein, partial [Vicinamibacterales bacterium]
MKRRGFLKLAAAAASVGLSKSSPLLARPLRATSTEARLVQAPAIVTSPNDRPLITHGVASGDVSAGRAVIWSRGDRPARMFVEYATTDRFTNARRVRGPAGLDTSDFTTRLVLTDLPAGQRVFYRVLYQDLSDLRAWSDPATGSFTTPSVTGGDVSIAWSADTVGQGWGINPERGGLKLYETMLQKQPDIFINVGDTIYADQPLEAEVRLDDGTMWKNQVTPAKSKVAETLADYRGCHQYNLMDDHLRRFGAAVSQIVMWDDHEVVDNWYWERRKDADPRYSVKSVSLLAARARQAFFDYNPLPLFADDSERLYRSVSLGPLVDVFALDMRTFHGANSENRQSTLDAASSLLGPSQLEWLKSGLKSSRATWKIIAADLPLGLVVPDGATHFEAVANDDSGRPLGRELEIANLLS